MLFGDIYQSPNSDKINFAHLCTLMNLAFNSSASHVYGPADYASIIGSRKSRPLESGHRRYGVRLAIKYSYKLGQKNEFKF